MRGFRLLFVVASIGTLGIASFAGYATDRDAVTDLQAAQLAGGATSCGFFQDKTCVSPCSGSCYTGSANTTGTYGTPKPQVGCGGNSSCNQIQNPDVCFKA